MDESREEKAFQKLPNELLIKISTMLAPIDRACLAFVNRHVYSAIGHALSLSPQSRYLLLSRLERSGEFLTEFLCQSCRKFHLPRKCKTWTIQEGRRACISNGDERALRYVDSPHLPSQVYFDIVAVISRNLRFGSRHYGLGNLASHHTDSYGDAKMSIKWTAKMAQGCFLLKTEMMLVPASNREKALGGIPMLLKLLQKDPSLLGVCQHANWIEIWPFVFRPSGTLRRPKCQKLQGGGLGFVDVDQKALHKCLWAHERTCWLRCKASSRLESAFERLWACASCSTDYSMTTLQVGKPYLGSNILVLTSWKNLGEGHDVYDKQWREHMRTIEDSPKTPRSTGLWTIAPSFEEGEVERTWFSYYPSIRDVPKDLLPQP